jgi:hypothetical protein
VVTAVQLGSRNKGRCGVRGRSGDSLKQVAVRIGRQRDAGVSEDLRDHLDWHAGRQTETRCAVPRVVQADSTQPGLGC